MLASMNSPTWASSPHVRSDDLFADVGANIGSYTILAAAGIGSQVITFEPDSIAFDWLTRNIGLNGVRNRVEARREAVGESLGRLRMTFGRDTVNHVLAAPSFGNKTISDASSQEVPATTLDAALGQRVPVLVKIDVEGFETAVVAGGGATFANPKLKAVLMELIGDGRRYGYDGSAIRSRMAAWGFRRCRYDAFARCLEELPDGEASEGNTLFVRDLAFVRDRLQSAPAFRVHGRTV